MADSPSANAASRASTIPCLLDWEAMPNVAPDLDRRLGVGERLPELSFGPAQRGVRAQVGGALLEVGGMLDTREHLEEATGTVELAALDVDLDRRLEQAQQGSAGVDLLLRELRGGRVRVVPATEHEERIRPLGQHRPLGTGGCRPSA